MTQDFPGFSYCLIHLRLRAEEASNWKCQQAQTKKKKKKKTKARCQVGNKAMKIKLTNMLTGKERKKRKKEWICKIK